MFSLLEVSVATLTATKEANSPVISFNGTLEPSSVMIEKS